eukprot:s500_g8.t1
MDSDSGLDEDSAAFEGGEEEGLQDDVEAPPLMRLKKGIFQEKKEIEKESLQEALKLLKESKEREAELRRKLEVSQEERQKLEEEASAKLASKGKPSDPFSTPPDKIIRSGSAPFSDGSVSEPSEKKRKVQFGLSKFFGTPQEEESAQPVALSTDLRLRNRQQKSQLMMKLEAERDWRRKVEASGVLESRTEQQIVEAEEDSVLEEREFYRKAGLKGGRPPADHSERRGVSGGLGSNRKKSLEAPKRREFTAIQKKEICEEFRSILAESPSKQDALQKLRKKLNLSSERLRDILNNEGEWSKILAKHRLGKGGLKKRGVKPGEASKRTSKGVRRSGAGRKLEFPDQVLQLKRWISRERSHGHALQKAFVGRKFEAILLAEAEKQLQKFEAILLAEAEKQLQSIQELTDPLQIALAKTQARRFHQKVQTLRNAEKVKQRYIQRLLDYCGAKYMGKELTTNLSPLEEKVRIQLSWQSLDWQLWLAGSAPLEALKDEGVADPGHVIECRKLGPPPLCFADQIPLWAKLSSKKFVFSAEEFSGSSTSDRAQFDLFRQDLQQAAEYFSRREDKQQLVSAESRPEGAHCRLSNLSDQHTFLETEKFQMNGQDFEHVAGQKTRLMWNLVELRKKEPGLFENLEVQQQPSSNVDSVILTWSIQEQAKLQAYSVWQRDSFSAIFLEPVQQTQAIASQFSAVLLGKTTQKLQLTDADFAKEMKVDFRKAMQDIQYEKGTEFKIGLREILVACNAAHLSAVERNKHSDWVVRGAVRNGLLVYVPTEQGLVSILSEELRMGSHRIPSETFLPRKPQKPDFNLSGQATQLQDFIEWSYKNPVEDEPSDQLDIQGPLEEDLEIPLQNALYLRLSPELRNDVSRAKLDVTFAALQEKAKQAAEKKKEKKEQRTSLRSLNFKALREKLKKMSKLEAMAEIKPCVVSKKKNQKRGAIQKGKLAMRKKVKKNLKKSAKKQQLEKEAVKLLQKEKLGQDSECAPIEDGAPAATVSAAAKVAAASKGSAKGRGKAGRGRGKGAAKASAKPSEASSEDKMSAVLPAGIKGDPLSVRVVSEEAGQVHFGFEGDVEKQHFETRGKEDLIHMFSTKVLNVKVGYLQKIEAAWQKAAPWKKFTHLSRVQAGAILDTLGLRPEPFVENTDTLLEEFAHDNDLSEQHLHLAAQLFSWSFPAYTKDVQWVNPYLLRQIHGETLNPGDIPGTPPKVFQDELKALASKALLILLPVHSEHPNHWCLLAGSRATLEDDFSWRYRDTLLEFSKQGLANAKKFSELISGPKAKFEKIPCLLQKGSTCEAWRGRLKSLWLQLKQEETKLLHVKVEAEAKQEKLRKQQEKELEKAQKILSEITDLNSAQAKKASESLTKNSQYFRPNQLSQDSKDAILKASAGIGVCARCRWSSGCLSCSAQKALAYFCKVEAAKLQKVVKISGLWLCLSCD